MGGVLRRGAALGCVAAVIAAAGASAAGPRVSAHRGGSLVNGVPTYGENTLPAFAAAAARGDVLEFDVHVTKDGVPIVIHDDTVTRVTQCKATRQPISRLTWSRVRICKVSYLGRPGETASAPDPTPEPIPTLAEVLSLARTTGARIAPEIKSVPPTDPGELDSDFDATAQVALKVAQAIKASGFPPGRVTFQSFWPVNLDVARTVLPGAQYSFLTLAAMNAIGPAYAAADGFAWVSPDFSSGVDQTYVDLAHLLGRKVTGYTINTAAGVAKARQLGLDEVITDDAVMARGVLGS